MSSGVGYETEYFVPDEAEIELQEQEPLSPDMDEVEVQTLVGQMAEDGLDWRENHLDPFLAEATKYYRGEKFGNEEKGRSQVIIPTVRNTWRQTAPQLLRVFFGAESAVEFQPRQPEDVDIAKQQTDAVEFAIREDNNGFLVFHDWFKDAVVRRLGIVKWWWQDNDSSHVEVFRGLTLEEVGFVLARFEDELAMMVDDVSTEEVGTNRNGDAIYDARIVVTVSDGRAKFACVPPEEIVWNATARDRGDAVLIGHVADVHADKLIAMGVDPELVEQHRGDTRARHSEEVEFARRFDQGARDAQADVQDEATDDVQFGELYARIDVDGDGIAELRKFETIGTDWVIVNGDGFGELVDEIPFAFLSPDPEPHEFVGLGQSDTTMQIQKMKSFVARAMFDSLAHAIDPVTEVVAGEVNMKDVMSRSLSRVIRANRPGMVREVPHRWVGQEALEAMRFLDEENEAGTGQMRNGQGLNPDALQSSTQAAVMASVQGAHQQLELIARIFAETGVKDLFRGLLRLMVEHQDETRRRVMRIRGEFIPVDPSKWDATMDVKVNVALGTGLPQEKLAVLDAVIERQFALMELGAPIVSWRVIRNTLARYVETAGWPNPNEFWETFGPEEQQAWMERQQQAAQQPGPEERLVAVEEMRAQIEQFKTQTEAELKRREQDIDAALKREEMALDFTIQGEKIRAEYEGKTDVERLRAQATAVEKSIDADLEREKMRTTAEQGGETEE